MSVDFGTAPEKFNGFKQMLDENAKASVSHEPGCRELNVYAVASQPNRLLLFEFDESKAAFPRHTRSAHCPRFNEASTHLSHHFRQDGLHPWLRITNSNPNDAIVGGVKSLA